MERCCKDKESQCCHHHKQDKQPRRLVVFDFDHTIIETDSVYSMGEFFLDPENMPIVDKEKTRVHGHIDTTNEVLKRMHECLVQSQHLRAFFERAPETEGILSLMRWLKRINCEMIVISDSTDIFIKTWLQAHSVSYCFKKVFANPAAFAPHEGPLVIKPFMNQCDCKWCVPNMCKGKVLSDYLYEQEKAGNKYFQVVYVGDGYNDFCAGLRLGEKDIACIRKGYRWEQRLASEKSKVNHKAQNVLWNNGVDLVQQLAPIFCKQQSCPCCPLKKL